MGLIYYLSDRPSLDIEEFFFAQDKVAHAIVFGILGVLFLASMQPASERYRLRQVWIAVGLTAIYGVFDEWHQAFVPGRSPDAWDVVADTIGALIAVTLMYRLAARSYNTGHSRKSGLN
jgi:VanZ family protein